MSKLPIVIRKMGFSFKDIISGKIIDYGGWGNGYVLLPPDHLYYNIDYDDIPVDVYGGLTFSNYVSESGFKHKIDEKYHNYWCIGFDTAHSGDNSFNWPKERVLEETIKLKKQLEQL